MPKLVITDYLQQQQHFLVLPGYTYSEPLLLLDNGTLTCG